MLNQKKLRALETETSTGKERQQLYLVHDKKEHTFFVIWD